MRVLYITHYGILEPLGQTQILPYLTGLAAAGNTIDILSFEKAHMLRDCPLVDCQRDRLLSVGIRWFPRLYRRGNSLRHILVDIFVTAREIRRRCIHDDIHLLHCRAHVPSWMAWPAAARYGIPLLFDFRGFMAEEYADAGVWSARGLRFRLTKALERTVARRCSALVTLTVPVCDYLQQAYSLDRNKLFVIPCCVEPAKFQREEVSHLPPAWRPLKVIYVGSTAGRYRVKEMLDFFALLHKTRAGSHFTILTSSSPQSVLEIVAKSPVPPGAVTVDSVPPDKVAGILAHQDLGLIFINGSLALLASSPTKLGEYLAAGLTVVAESTLGDLQRILVDESVGCLIDSGQPATWPGVLEEALRLCEHPGARQNARRTAAKYFSLAEGVKTYIRAYEHAVRKA